MVAHGVSRGADGQTQGEPRRGGRIFRPSGACSGESFFPMADAMGYDLTPLRGCECRGQHPHKNRWVRPSAITVEGELLPNPER